MIFFAPLFSLLLFSSPLQALEEENPIITLPRVDDYASEDYKGSAFILLERLLPKDKNKYKIKVFPLKRAILNFKAKRTHCFLGSTSKSFKEAHQLTTIDSEPFSYSSLHVWSLKSLPKAKTLKDLDNEILLIYRGSRQILDVKKNKIKYKDLIFYDRVEQGLDLLEANKVKYMVLWDHKQSKELNEKAHFHDDFKLTSGSARLVCHETKQTKKLIEIFNQNLPKHYEGIQNLFKKKN